MKIELGKYTYIFDEKTGVQEALRHGEPWRKEDLVGDNLVLAMAMKIEELQQELGDLMSQDTTSRYNDTSKMQQEASESTFSRSQYDGSRDDDSCDTVRSRGYYDDSGSSSDY